MSELRQELIDFFKGTDEYAYCKVLPQWDHDKDEPTGYTEVIFDGEFVLEDLIAIFTRNST